MTDKELHNILTDFGHEIFTREETHDRIIKLFENQNNALSLRDHFADNCPSSILARESNFGADHESIKHEAKLRYQYASAMMTEREKIE